MKVLKKSQKVLAMMYFRPSFLSSTMVWKWKTITDSYPFLQNARGLQTLGAANGI
jgi:hypothetical protein